MEESSRFLFEFLIYVLEWYVDGQHIHCFWDIPRENNYMLINRAILPGKFFFKWCILGSPLAVWLIGTMSFGGNRIISCFKIVLVMPVYGDVVNDFFRHWLLKNMALLCQIKTVYVKLSLSGYIVAFGVLLHMEAQCPNIYIAI